MLQETEINKNVLKDAWNFLKSCDKDKKVQYMALLCLLTELEYKQLITYCWFQNEFIDVESISLVGYIWKYLYEIHI